MLKVKPNDELETGVWQGRVTPKAFAKSWMNSDSGSSDDGSNKKPLLRKRHCSAKAASNVSF